MKLYGKLLDVNYTKRLQNEDISLEETIKLDRLRKELFVKKSVDQNNDGENTETAQKSTVKILELIKENPNITRQEMASIIGITIEGIDKNIRKLKTENKITRIGSDKTGYWEIVK